MINKPMIVFSVVLCVCAGSTLAALAHERVLAPRAILLAATDAHKTQTAYFAGGCFWGVEERFRRLPGVKSTTVGYCGGSTKEPTYEQVCTGKTGHAETVKVEYDPSVVSYQKLVRTFFEAHDPTSLNRQGPDHGTQYRSAIFYDTVEQKSEALTVKQQFQRLCSRPIVTEIAPDTGFFNAEEYHQQYLEKHGLAECH